MVKSELINKIAKRYPHLPIKAVEMCVHNTLDIMSDALSYGERIEIRGFGSLKLNFRPPRNAHNPKTGEKVATIAKYTPHFKPGKELRERVNACYGQPIIDDTEE
ncbi:MAG: integration host factor subunit beta [Pseudomonadota bacterium]|nr:integration host factor subunit beta [Pseudomonadota bacterium]